MPRYDPETIAALAEGRLDPEEAAALEQEIAADPVAAAELAAQRVALQSLASAPPARLTASERADLRAAVADAIGITAPEPAPAPTRKPAPWGSLGIAAAALVALVAVVPLAGLLTTGEGDADIDLAGAATTTSAAAEGELRSAPAADEVEAAEAPTAEEADLDDALSLGQDAPAEASGFAASSTSVPLSTTTAAAAAPTTTTTPSPPTTSALDEEAIAELTADLEAIKSDPEAVTALAAEALEDDACWVEDTEIRGDPPPQRFRFEYIDGQITVVVYFELEEGVAGPFRVWGVPDCADLVVIP